jgi:DNA-binding winged helix-turn-helix (wHTH) protein
MAADQLFSIGGLRFDAASGELSAPARSRRLEPRAAAVLAALCASRGQVVTRQALLDHCWGDGEGSDEALTQAVSQIRRTFQDLGAPTDLIETLAKRGYRLNGDGGPATNPPLPAQATTGRRGLVVAGVALLFLVAAIVAAPHGIRHSMRHAFGLGPAAH